MHRLNLLLRVCCPCRQHGDVRCAQNDDTRLNVTLKADSGELQRCIIDTIHSVAGPAPARNRRVNAPVAVKHCPELSHFTEAARSR